MPYVRADHANELRRHRPRPGDKWHLDEVFVSINGAQHYLWRAVDQGGNVLDILARSGAMRRRFKSAGHARRFLAAYGSIAGHFRPRRHRLTAAAYRATRHERFATWQAVTGTPALA